MLCRVLLVLKARKITAVLWSRLFSPIARLFRDLLPIKISAMSCESSLENPLLERSSLLIVTLLMMDCFMVLDKRFPWLLKRLLDIFTSSWQASTGTMQISMRRGELLSLGASKTKKYGLLQ
jgi:hypothetical protein